MNYEEFKKITRINFNELSPTVFYKGDLYNISRIEENYLEVFHTDSDKILKISYQDLYDNMNLLNDLTELSKEISYTIENYLDDISEEWE